MLGKLRWIGFGVGLITVLFTGSCGPDAPEKVLGMIAEACVGDSVVVSTTDNTPPAVWLRFSDPATLKPIQLHSGGSDLRIPLKASQAVLLGAFAEDPEGIYQLIMVPMTDDTIKCQPDTPSEGPPVGQTVFKTYPSDPQMLPSKVTTQALPGETATKRLCYLYQVNQENPCEKGSHAPEYSIRVYAQAQNFSGLVSKTPVVTFTVTH